MVSTQALQKTEAQPAKRAFSPPTDIYETDEAIVLVADLPGVEEESLDISLENNTLKIYGSIGPQEPQGYNLAYSEYGSGDYERSFALSDKVDGEKIDAAFSNGVLKLKLAKTKKATARKIPVKAGK